MGVQGTRLRASWLGARLSLFVAAGSKIKEDLTGSLDGIVDFYLSGGEEMESPSEDKE